MQTDVCSCGEPVEKSVGRLDAGENAEVMSMVWLVERGLDSARCNTHEARLKLSK